MEREPTADLEPVHARPARQGVTARSNLSCHRNAQQVPLAKAQQPSAVPAKKAVTALEEQVTAANARQALHP